MHSLGKIIQLNQKNYRRKLTALGHIKAALRHLKKSIKPTGNAQSIPLLHARTNIVRQIELLLSNLELMVRRTGTK